jgi:hypothetical protein
MSFPSRSPRLCAIVLMSGLSISSCGFGTGAVLSTTNDRGGSANAPASPTGLVVLGQKQSPARLQLVLRDFEGDAVEVQLSYALPSAPNVERPITRVAANPVRLAASRQGTVHEIPWDFAAEEGLGTGFTSNVVVVARLPGGVVQSTVVGLGNDAPRIDQVVAPTTEISGVVPIGFRLSDSSTDAVNVTVEYFVEADPGAGWRRARPAGNSAPATGPQLPALFTTVAGTTTTFFWDTDSRDTQGAPLGDLVDLERDVRVRLLATDGFSAGTPTESAVFRIDNNAPPAVTIGDGGVLQSGDLLRGIPIPFQTTDAEGDPVRVVFQWTRVGDPFPSLDATDAAVLAGLLQDPVFRRQKQICTPYPLVVGGKPEPRDAQRLRLPELSKPEAGWLVKRGLAGTEVELLRPPAGELVSLAAGWGTNPLNGPIAALPHRDGLAALVFDQLPDGTCRILDVDLVSGTAVVVASGIPGTGTAMTRARTGSALLVATESGGTWQLTQVGSDGSLVTIATGAPGAGRLHGVAAITSSAVVATNGNALIRIDWRSPQTPAVNTVITGLAEPLGVAVEPRRADRIYLAERSHGLGSGRIAVVDLATRSVETLLPGSGMFPRPTAVSVPEDGSRIDAICQPVGVASPQLRTFAFGTDASSVRVLGGVTGAVSVASGDENLTLVASTAADLLVRGGIEQRRMITTFEGRTHTVTVDRAFAPTPSHRSTWRIRPLDPFFHPRQGGETISDDRFLWDSREATGNAGILLRAQAVDTELGTTASSSGTITLDAGFGSPSTLPGNPLEFGDIDGDGLPDVVVAGASIHVQTQSGVFSPTPLATLPVATEIHIADIDGDGRADVLGSGQDLYIAWQEANGAFTIATLATNILHAVAVDIDQNGRLDVVDTTGRLFRHSATPRVFLPSLTTNLSSFGAQVPADVNGDGRVDFVVGGAGIEYAIQQSDGTFTRVPGAQGTSSTLVILFAAGDLNADAGVDVAVVFQGFVGNDRLVIGPVTFTELNYPGIVSGIQSLRIADVDGDGHSDVVLERATETGVLFQGADWNFHYERVGSAGSRLLDDANRDGQVDLVTGSQLSLQASRRQAVPSVALSGGPQSDEWSSFPPVSFNGDVAFADGGDGYLDIVVSTTDSLTDSGNDLVFAQTAPGTFAPVAFFRGFSTNFIGDQLGLDLNGDGSAEIAAATCSFFGSNGGLVVGNATISSSAIQLPLSLVAADLDGDGDIDFATANRDSDNVAVYYQSQSGTFSFTLLGSSTTTDAPNSIAAGDVDGDGRADLVVGVANGIAIFRQKANGQFGSVQQGVALPDQTIPTLPNPVVVVADLDSDGRLDVASNYGIHLQRPDGSLPATPDSTTPIFGTPVDLDGNGLMDLGGPGMLFQVAPGVFESVAGGPGGTQDNLPVDLDADGDYDLVGVNPTRVVWRGR